MKSSSRAFGLFATTALVCSMGASAALAQTAASPAAPVAELDTVVVTARRVEERLQDVPISISVFSQQQLTNRNIVNPSDLATYTPSLSTNSRFGPAKSSFSIRGFVQDLGTAPSVAFYFADVVAPRANGPTTSGNGSTPGVLFDLQNVQVLKGPQGTLFGRNTTGGAILAVPQKPTDKYEGYVEGSVGNYDMKRVQAVANLPINDVARFRLGVDRMTQDGFLKNKSGVGPKDFNNIDYWGVRGSLVLDLTPTIENYTITSYNRSDTNGALPHMIACARNPALRTGGQIFLAQAGCNQLDRQTARGDGFYDVENNLANPYERLKQWQVINTTTWKASDTLTIKNIVSYGEFHEATHINIEGDNLFVPSTITINRGTATAPVLINVPTGASAGQPVGFVNITPGPTGYQAAQSTLTEEFQLQGRTSDDRLVWQAGLYMERSRPIENGTQLSSIFLNCTDPLAFQCNDPLGPFAGGVFGQVSLNDLSYEFRNWGAYAQSSFKITDKLSVTGGFRLTRDWIRGTAQSVVERYRTPNTPTFNCTKNGTVLPSLDARAACKETIVQDSSKPTWLIDVDYKPTDDVLLYGKYARGYRQGLVNLIPTGREFETANPEKVDTYELGAKTSFRGPIRGTFNVAAFYNDFTNQQLQANLIAKPGRGVGGNVLLNAGKSVIKGVEIDTSLRLFEGFQLDASYAYLDTELKSITLPTLDPNGIYSALIPTSLVGEPLALSPKNRVTVTGTYTLPLDQNIGRVSIAATFTHTDKQVASHSDDPYVGQIGYNPGQLPATDLLNLNLNWNGIGGKPVDLSLFATNVTNKKYWVNTTQSFPSAGYETIVLGAPRMYGMRLRYRFGG